MILPDLSSSQQSLALHDEVKQGEADQYASRQAQVRQDQIARDSAKLGLGNPVVKNSVSLQHSISQKIFSRWPAQPQSTEDAPDKESSIEAKPVAPQNSSIDHENSAREAFNPSINQSTSVNPDPISESKYFVKHLSEQEKNISELKPEKKTQLPKLKICQSNHDYFNKQLAGPGSYQINYGVVERHTPNALFQQYMPKTSKNQQQGNVDRFLPIFERPAKKPNNQGYEQIFMRLIRDINRTVRHEQNKNQNNLLHPNKLCLPHIDAQFVDDFEKNYNKKFRQAKNMCNHMKLLMKTDFN